MPEIAINLTDAQSKKRISGKCIINRQFYYLMKLHYSQTSFHRYWSCVRFCYLMKLHYSQTINSAIKFMYGFVTLWNYTTLKPHPFSFYDNKGFTTLWNYTTLKPQISNESKRRTLQIAGNFKGWIHYILFFVNYQQSHTYHHQLYKFFRFLSNRRSFCFL